MTRLGLGVDDQASSAPGPVGDPANFYEVHQAWPPEVTGAVAEHLYSTLPKPAPRKCLFLGAATGVNDVLPFARLADPTDRVLGSDVVLEYLECLRDHALREGLQNVEVRPIDIRAGLEALGTFDLVTLFFVLHRLLDWRGVVAPLAGLVGDGGSLFVSEFAGPSGIIYISNERGGTGGDPVSGLIRRYFELLPGTFNPALKSTSISPVREGLAQFLRPAGFRDFVWRQRITAGDMYIKIASKAYAPFFSTHALPELLESLRLEFARHWQTPVEMAETIRIYRFLQARGEA